MNKYPSQTQDKFTVRFPDGLRDAVAKRAEANGRSMNSEIVQIIEDAIAAEESGVSLSEATELKKLMDIQKAAIDRNNELMDTQKAAIDRNNELMATNQNLMKQLSEILTVKAITK
ncbi:Arc family DNA-binding protein [Xenorhabdus sp. TS4]|uniref:Arc family DNA-binding protein n=1 Tax=Xenorhabdus sp. TS4 TaxID=1873483 RepID=UPI0016575D46|nr:Arc family DNA-binding protein [Xenorhabdus sp. TS4]MBC8950259.1 hypothetical protein [Xenorhabdus sp. TS4]